MSEQNKALARRIVNDHWNAKNVALADELFSPTCSLRTPDGDGQGREALVALSNAYTSAFPDFNLRIDDLIAEADKVVVLYTFTGTNTGSLAGLPASGKRADVQGFVRFTIANRKAAAVHFVWDKFALLQQMGALAQAAS